MATGTAQRIERAASKLFARDGVGATSIRAIVGEANANLNAVHYHFGSREALVAAVFLDAIGPISRERAELLADEPTTVSGVVEAMYWPVLRRGGPGASATDRRRLSIIAQLRNDPSDAARWVLDQHQAHETPAFERLLAITLGVDEPAFRFGVRMVNAAAWDLASSPSVLADMTEDLGSIEAVAKRFCDHADATLQAKLKEGGR